VALITTYLKKMRGLFVSIFEETMSYAILRKYPKSKFLTSNEAKALCSGISLGNTYKHDTQKLFWSTHGYTGFIPSLGMVATCFTCLPILI
jgi:hypothetical protein